MSPSAAAAAAAVDAAPGPSAPAVASSPPPTGGSGGGGSSLYHVAAVDQGLHLEPETLSYWGYDDGTSTLLVCKGGLVFAYDMSATVAPGSPEQLKWTFQLPDGPPVRAMRLSLDGGLLAIQRSSVLLEFLELASGNVFVQGTDRGRSEILMFFFTELVGSEVVVVTPTGLELMEFVPRRQGLRLRERVRLPIDWALYTHETRMVLLGTTAGGTSYIKAFQFVSSGLVALPPFTAGAAASAMALMGAAAAGAAALVAGSPLAAAAVATPPARVAADCLRLLKVYGRVYCAHINRRTLKLELYRFYTDTVVLQHTYELFSPHVDLAVVDSVIVAHYTDAAAPLSGVAMLFDVAAPSLQPIANPLPLRPLRHRAGAPAAAALILPYDDGSNDDDGGDDGRGGQDNANGGGGGGGSGSGAADAAAMGGGADGVPGGGGAAVTRRWEYLAPNVVLDRGSQTVYRLALNLPGIVESCSEPAILAGFLQRRRGSTPAAPPTAAAAPGAEPAAPPPEGAAQQQPKALLLSVVRNALQERMPMTTVRAIFEDLCTGYAAALDRELAALAGGAALAPPPPPLPPTAVPMPQYVTADELASALFRWLHDEEVVDAPYLQAALCEYMSAAFAAGIPLPPYLQELLVEILLQQSQAGQVLQLLYSQADHVAPEVVDRLLAAAPPPAGAVATDAASDDGGAAAADSTSDAATQGPLCRQLGVDALARSALAARYEPVAHAAGAAGARLAGAADASVYVEALLAQGDVLRAARVMRRYRVTKPSVKEFLAAVAARGDEAAFAAVYRTFQDELLSCYPKYDLAVRKVLASPAAVAAV